MIDAIRLMLQKAYELDVSLAWGSLDVASAFERVQHDTIARAYRFRKASREFVLVVERSLRSTVRIVAYGKAGERIVLERGTRMGTMESPGYFNTALVYILAGLVVLWEKAGMLVEWKTSKKQGGESCDFEGSPIAIAILLWADNIYPIANSLENWAKMVSDIQKALVEEGMEIKPKEHFVQTNDTERRQRRRAAQEAGAGGAARPKGSFTRPEELPKPIDRSSVSELRSGMERTGQTADEEVAGHTARVWVEPREGRIVATKGFLIEEREIGEVLGVDVDRKGSTETSYRTALRKAKKK